MTTQKNKISTKLSKDSIEFFKKFRLNIIRVGGSEKALDLSYADLMDWIVKYFKFDNSPYTKMLQEIAKNV
jgi:hypothetical protein